MPSTDETTFEQDHRDSTIRFLIGQVSDLRAQLNTLRARTRPSAPVDWKAQLDRLNGTKEASGTDCARVLSYGRGYIELEDLLRGDDKDASAQ
jgi:hypothetical protein